MPPYSRPGARAGQRICQPPPRLGRAERASTPAPFRRSNARHPGCCRRGHRRRRRASAHHTAHAGGASAPQPVRADHARRRAPGPCGACPSSSPARGANGGNVLAQFVRSDRDAARQQPLSCARADPDDPLSGRNRPAFHQQAPVAVERLPGRTPRRPVGRSCATSVTASPAASAARTDRELTGNAFSRLRRRNAIPRADGRGLYLKAVRLQLVPGIALSAGQMAQLTTRHRLAGRAGCRPGRWFLQKVLVPQVYATVRDGDLTAGGLLLPPTPSTLRSTTTYATAQPSPGDLIVTLTADNIGNIGGRIDAQDLTLVALRPRRHRRYPAPKTG